MADTQTYVGVTCLEMVYGSRSSKYMQLLLRYIFVDCKTWQLHESYI
jgi:hypothetical protein